MVVAGMVWLTALTWAQASGNATTEIATRDALQRFITEWNTGDDASLRTAMHFPFVTIAGDGTLIVNQTADDFSAGFEQLRDTEEWSRSEFYFDSFTVVKSSPNKVHAEVNFARYREDGTAYLRSCVFHIVTRRDNRWAIQLRTRAASPTAFEPDARTAMVHHARDAVRAFFTAFNRGNVDGTVATLHHPHLFVAAPGDFAMASTETDGPRPNFDQMHETERWHVSTIDAIEPSVVTPHKVHMELTFSRWRLDGTRYWTLPATCIVTRAGDHWDIQVRSLFPATFDER